MTGADIEFWLEGIWYDLTDLSSADVPLLVFKLVVLFVVAFFGWQLGRMVVRAAWSVVGPLLELLWRISCRRRSGCPGGVCNACTGR